MARRVLLVNPAVFDTKFLWARWQEPTLLAKISTYLKARGAEVRFIDVTSNRKGPKPLRRERTRKFNMDGLPVYQWRYGESESWVRREMRALTKAHWWPDVVIIECFATMWWRGAREVALLAREAFPQTRIAVVGSSEDLILKPTQLGDRRYDWVGAEVVCKLPLEVHKAAPDWTLGDRAPLLGYLSQASGIRPADAIVDDIESGVRAGVTTFAFCDSALLRHGCDGFATILEKVLAKKWKVRFVAPGTISVHDFVGRLELVPLMRRAGFRQLVLSDDRHLPATGPASWEAEAAFLNACRCVIPALIRGGFAHRTDAIAAAISLGRTNENLMQRSAFLTQVAHVVGSAICWPYQPTSTECASVGLAADLELQNGKLFPLRSTSNASYRDYLNVLGLAVVLNSKYREHTFDFLGSGFIADMFRQSLVRRAWEPDARIKGGLRLPVLPARPHSNSDFTSTEMSTTQDPLTAALEVS